MTIRSDKILPITRVVGAVVIPFLWLAFVILSFFPETTGTRFAWHIQPDLTAMYMGAGYLGGSVVFVNAVFGRRWHRIQAGFWPITTFTWFMMAATFIYWDRMAHENLGFVLWLILYVVTPFLVPVVWFLNQRTFTWEPEERDALIPAGAQWLLRVVGAATLIFVVAAVFNREFIIRVWPWQLTPLSGLTMSGWLALLGVGALIISFERRWSGWKVPMLSIALWHLFLLIAMVLRRDELTAGLLNWYAVVSLVLVGSTLLMYPWMERASRRR